MNKFRIGDKVQMGGTVHGVYHTHHQQPCMETVSGNRRTQCMTQSNHRFC